MRRAFRIVTAIALLVAAACDEFTDGAPASDAGNGTGGDASVDGASPGDGGADAPSGPFCKTVDATFCWSFDDDSSGNALLGPTFSPHGRAVSLTQEARSAPNALAATGDGDAGLWMLKMPLEAEKRVACTIAVWFENITDHTEVLMLQLGSNDVGFLVEKIGDGTVRWSLLYDRVGRKAVEGLNLPLKQWIDVTLAGERIDGGVALAAQANGKLVTIERADAGDQLFASQLNLLIGFFSMFGGAGSVRIDDVRCTYQ